MVIRNVELETVCGITSKIPDNMLAEIAFAGKSNVGKSSLINALMNRKSLARTSSQPGKTQAEEEEEEDVVPAEIEDIGQDDVVPPEREGPEEECAGRRQEDDDAQGAEEAQGILGQQLPGDPARVVELTQWCTPPPRRF